MCEKRQGSFAMTLPLEPKPDETMSYQSPAGQILAGEVIARFLLRLSHHRRVMRLAGRMQLRRIGEQG
jgi:hypothetical protein